MKLRELRERENLTQEQFALKHNITRATYANYESGKTQPDYKTLIKFADYFNVTLDYLVGRNFATTFALDGLKPEQKEAVKLLLSLNNLNFIKAVSYMGGLYANQ